MLSLSLSLLHSAHTKKWKDDSERKRATTTTKKKIKKGEKSSG